jgi:hypothetical protein
MMQSLDTLGSEIEVKILRAIIEELKAESELVQLTLNIESSMTKGSSGGFRRSRTSQKEFLAAKSESTPTEAE